MIGFDFDEDLDALQRAQDEGIEVPILKPGTQDVMLTIRVCGPDSAQAGRALERDAEERLAAPTPPTREESADRSARLLARHCMSWDAKTTGGEPVPFTEDAAFEALRRFPVLRVAVDRVAGSRDLFAARVRAGQ